MRKGRNGGYLKVFHMTVVRGRSVTASFFSMLCWLCLVSWFSCTFSIGCFEEFSIYYLN